MLRELETRLEFLDEIETGLGHPRLSELQYSYGVLVIRRMVMDFGDFSAQRSGIYWDVDVIRCFGWQKKNVSSMYVSNPSNNEGP